MNNNQTDFRALCAEVLAFNNGESPYNFSGLTPYDRDNAAFDAWQDIRQRLKSALRRAQLEPGVPTEEEIKDWHSRCADLTRLGEAEHYWAFDLDSDKVADVVSAALALWGK